MCIFCYLSDYKQNHIREGIQLRTDRFEQTLDTYKNSFIHGFQSNLKEDLCNEYNCEENLNLKEQLEKINKVELESFFTSLENIYVDWINSNPSDALKNLDALLKDYSILDLTFKLEQEILFRGRESDYILSDWDMFHIPFNKRYLIGNQRYSLIGQPLLYLASSPYCVFKELKKTKNIKLSAFQIKTDFKLDSYTKNSLLLFDNTNNFFKLVKQYKGDNDLNSFKDIDNFFLSHISEKEVKKYLFQYLLSCCCSFRQSSEKSNYNFCEEYVLPQILAQVVKKAGFSGIVFNSTSCFSNKALSKNTYLFNLLCKNYCIFTEYDKTKLNDSKYVYDRTLYEKFKISTPITYNHCNVDKEYYKIDKTNEILNTLYKKYPLNNLLSSLMVATKDYLCEYLNPDNKDIFQCDCNLEPFTKKESSENKLLRNSIILHTLIIRNILLDIRDSF